MIVARIPLRGDETGQAAHPLLAHADALEHVAALGGYLDPVSGSRVALGEAQRRAWAGDAAVLREAALSEQEALGGAPRAVPGPEAGRA